MEFEKKFFYNSIKKTHGILRKKFHEICVRLCTKDYKILLREIQEDLEKWREMLFMDWKTQYC